MIYNLYSVRDVKTSFAAPFIDVSDASAERGFMFAFQNQSNLMHFSPADFALYRVGLFDTESGHLTDQLPEFICDATKFSRNVGDDFEA